MKNKKTISLLGCGWLGFPLAVSLHSKGFPVKASTTTAGKLPAFKKAGIDPYLVHFTPEDNPGMDHMLNADVLIVSIPPGRAHPAGFTNYLKMVDTVCHKVPGSRVSKIILVSSTSVYADVNDVITERSAISPDSASGKLMAATESRFADLPVDLVILRLSGLIGPQRMPGKFFAGKTHIANGRAPVNLVHRDDVVRLIEIVIADPLSSGVYNVSAPSHPSREEFYTVAAASEGLPRPGFITEKTSWKIISSRRLKEELNFEFEIADLMVWLKGER